MPEMRRGTKEDIRQMSQVLLQALVVFLQETAGMAIIYWALDLEVAGSQLGLQVHTER
jgi:hypothetical protein